MNEHSNSWSDGFEYQETRQLEVGTATETKVYLNQGIALCIHWGTIHQGIYWENLEHRADQFVISFCLSGTFKSCKHGLTSEEWEAPWLNYTEYLPGIRETEWWLAKQVHQRVRIVLSLATLPNLVTAAEYNLPQPLQSLIESGHLDPFCQLDPTTPAVAIRNDS